jgi:hypothetical protein
VRRRVQNGHIERAVQNEKAELYRFPSSDQNASGLDVLALAVGNQPIAAFSTSMTSSVSRRITFRSPPT